MLSLLLTILKTVGSSLQSHRHLALENLALRQQLAMLKQSATRPRVSAADRLFWVLFSKYVDGWRAMIHALHPDTPSAEIALTSSSFNERHLRRILRDYLKYYHTSRTYLSLNKDPPEHRPIELPDASKIVLYHRSVAYITVIFESLHESGTFYR